MVAASPAPDVTIVIPTRNRPQLTVETIESVLAQDGVRVEILVVDDASDDDTPQRVRALRGPIRVLSQPRSGACAARNLGMDEARGRYLKFLDSDDLLEQGALAAQIEALDRTGADVCYGDWAYIGNIHARRVGNRPVRIMGETTDPIADLLGGEWWVSPFGYLHRTAEARRTRWDERLECLQDFDYMARRAIDGAQFAYVRRFVGYYRMHDGEQISKHRRATFARNRTRILDQAAVELRARGMLSERRKRGMACGYWKAARECFRIDQGAFNDCVRKVAALCPKFFPDGPGLRPLVTRWLGIPTTERLFHTAETLLDPILRRS